MFSPKDPVSSHAAAPSLIGRDVVITGILQSDGDIQIDGRVDGHVRGAGVVIGEDASIQGEIVAERITVRGKVEGAIRARKVALAAGCHVEGDILHETLEVEFGAFVQGHLRYAADPVADSVPALPDEETVERRRLGSPMRETGAVAVTMDEPQKRAAG